MGTIFLKETHPAFQALRDLGHDVQPIENAGTGALNLGIINLMPNPVDPVRDFAAACAHTDQDIAIYEFAPDPAQTKDPDRKSYRADYCEKITDIHKFKIDRAILTGFGVEDVPFEKLPFWSEVENGLDHIQENKIPLLASCWGSHAALYHYHKVDKTWDMTDKISGHFTQTVRDASHPLMQSIGSDFVMPVSRYGRSDDQQIREKSALSVLAENDQTGASIVVDDHVTYVTGHLEYAITAVADEYRRDLKNNVPHTKIPVDVFVNDDPEQGLLTINWEHAQKTFFGNWISQATDVSANKNQAPTLQASA